MLLKLETPLKHKSVRKKHSVLTKMLYYSCSAVCYVELDPETMMIVKNTCVILQPEVNHRLAQPSGMS